MREKSTDLALWPWVGKKKKKKEGGKVRFGFEREERKNERKKRRKSDCSPAPGFFPVGFSTSALSYVGGRSREGWESSEMSRARA